MSVENDTHTILPVYLWESSPKLGFSHEQLFGDPFLIAVSRKDCTYDVLYQQVLHKLQRNLRMPDDNSSWWNMKTKKISNGGKYYLHIFQFGIRVKFPLTTSKAMCHYHDFTSVALTRFSFKLYLFWAFRNVIHVFSSGKLYPLNYQTHILLNGSI
jgi:hypothetical protein